MTMKILKISLLFLGIYILYSTIQKISTAEIWGILLQVKWKFLPVLFFFFLIYCMNSLGWLYSFPNVLPKHVPFRDLLAIRVAGETLNAIVPWAGSMGGEPFKAEMLTNHYKVPLSEGF